VIKYLSTYFFKATLKSVKSIPNSCLVNTVFKTRFLGNFISQVFDSNIFLFIGKFSSLNISKTLFARLALDCTFPVHET
jgi:low temperature requirement protein LtrA